MSSGGLTGGIYKPLETEQVDLIHGEAHIFPASADREDGGSSPGGVYLVLPGREE